MKIPEMTVRELKWHLEKFADTQVVKIVLPKETPQGPDFSVLASCNSVGAIKEVEGEVLIERVI